jgi:hypothetical protein
MLTFKPLGPDANGQFSVAYETPGIPNSLTLHSAGMTEDRAKAECDRLNEEQVADMRLELRDSANRIVKDVNRGR